MASASTRDLPEPLNQHWATKAEAARLLKMSVSQVDRKAIGGMLEKSMYNGIAIISRESINNYLARFLPKKARKKQAGPTSKIEQNE